MEGRLEGNPSQHGIARDATIMSMAEESHCRPHKWYFSREEIEDHSPSRKDGVDLNMESRLRKLYCSFLQELGITLKVPQVTIATAMMLCHRFYMRQSHTKNDWQTIATVSMFLACKMEETPRLLRDVVFVGYEMIYRWNPSAPRKIRQKEVYDKQKELILIGERLLLATIAFDFNIQHPYKPLITALKRLKISHINLLIKKKISHNELAQVAWNFVNDWLRTTLCLQYKPHYIAAGSLFLAAKFHEVKLHTERGKVWWLEFDISPKQLEEVIQQMLRLLEQNREQALLPTREKVTESTAVVGRAMSHSPQSCILSGSTVAQYSSNRAKVESGVLGESLTSNSSQNLVCGNTRVTGKEVQQCQTSDSGSAISVVDDGDGDIQPRTGESNQNLGCKAGSVYSGYSKADVKRIREAMKRRRSDTAANKKSVVGIDDEMDDRDWIERELENGIEQESAHAKKIQKRVL